MCLLTFFPDNVMPDQEALATGAAINSDGHGFAIVTGNRLLVERDMNAAKLIDRFTVARRTHPEGPALFHSRMATAGDITTANCHPFRIGGDARTVLAHNGILPMAVQPSKRDKRSDTRIAAEDFLPDEPFGPLGNARARQRMERWLTDRNKIVILTVNRRFRRRAYVLNEHAGIWDDGVWYSNDDYQAGSLAYAQQYEVWDDDACAICATYPDPDDVTRICEICQVCLDCYEQEQDCACYLPPAARRVDDAGTSRWREELARLLSEHDYDAVHERGDSTDPIAV